MKNLYLWQIVKLARIPIFISAVVPFILIGVLFALQIGTVFSPVNVLWGLSIAFLIHLGTSFANDYFDYEADNYSKESGFSGGSGALLKYPELRPFVKWMSVTLMVLSIVITIIFTEVASFPLWTIGYILVAVFLCWFYTAPPLKFAYHGLGEIPHSIGGIMFPGWGFLLMVKTIDFPFLIFSIPFGILGLIIILNVEIPDREVDIHTGKNNFIVRKGRSNAFLTIMILYILTILYVVVLVVSGWYSQVIDFRVIVLILLLPTIFSIIAVLKKPNTRENISRYVIRNSIALSIAVYLIMFFLII